MPALGLDIVDCQAYTENMARYGAQNVNRETFINKLRKDLATHETNKGKWTDYF